MKMQAAMLLMTLAMLSGASAHAREPFEQESPPLPSPEPAPDPVAFVVPAGLYYVTDTYVADVIATSDATTTYSTTTVHESTGTFARVIDTVTTGESSTFDGRAFNGRGAMTDGRALSGTYYENFVLTANGYVPVNVVFFQDDSETRRRGSRSSATPATATPATTSAPGLSSAASRILNTPAPSFRSQAPMAPGTPTLRAGIALAPQGPTLAAVEVLRGRLIYFWPRAFANDAAVGIRGWRLMSAQADYVSPNAGSVEPLAAQWIRMPAADVRWSLRFEIFTEVAPTERLEAQISITVRSPALID